MTNTPHAEPQHDDAAAAPELTALIAAANAALPAETALQEDVWTRVQHTVTTGGSTPRVRARAATAGAGIVAAGLVAAAFWGARDAAPEAPLVSTPPLAVSAAPSLTLQPAVPAPSPPAPRLDANTARPRMAAAAEPAPTEEALIEQARRSLARGETAAARTALARHTALYPSGSLVEERRALTVVTIRQGGDSARAAAAAEAFLQKYPGSLFTDVVRGDGR